MFWHVLYFVLSSLIRICSNSCVGFRTWFCLFFLSSFCLQAREVMYTFYFFNIMCSERKAFSSIKYWYWIYKVLSFSKIFTKKIIYFPKVNFKFEKFCYSWKNHSYDSTVHEHIVSGYFEWEFSSDVINDYCIY